MFGFGLNRDAPPFTPAACAKTREMDPSMMGIPPPTGLPWMGHQTMTPQTMRPVWTGHHTMAHQTAPLMGHRIAPPMGLPWMGHQTMTPQTMRPLWTGHHTMAHQTTGPSKRTIRRRNRGRRGKGRKEPYQIPEGVFIPEREAVDLSMIYMVDELVTESKVPSNVLGNITNQDEPASKGTQFVTGTLYGMKDSMKNWFPFPSNVRGNITNQDEPASKGTQFVTGTLYGMKDSTKNLLPCFIPIVIK